MESRLAVIVLTGAVSLAATDAAAWCGQTAAARAGVPMPQVADEDARAPLSRVIVKVSETPTANDTAAGEEVIERNKATLVELMRGAGAVTIEPIAGQPLVVMEVTPQGMQNLLGSPLVEAVQEDRPEMPQ